MIKFLIRLFGLKGSWKWAVRQMLKGKIVRPASATGSVKYRFSTDKQNRIQYTFQHGMHSKDFVWENANIFNNDFLTTDWAIYKDTNEA